jgi:hypothetical protein
MTDTELKLMAAAAIDRAQEESEERVTMRTPSLCSLRIASD